jgi:phage terminase large subunit
VPQTQSKYKFQSTTATKKIFAQRGRIRAVAGGTSASKTISILFWLIDYAQSTKNEIISVVSESYPHLEDGAMRDFKAILQDRGYWKDELWHGTKHEYTFETGSVIEFLAVDTYGKAHGPRRDVLYVNECNNLDYNIVDQLITRTRKTVWLDWNPSNEFWFYTEMRPNRDDIDFITVTYKDNEALLDEPGQTTIKEIESHKNNKMWWQVYGLGQLGEIETQIYRGWQLLDEIPHEARLERRGLDFGYTNDPSSVCDVYSYNGGYILDERLFRKGMSNKQIADFLSNLEHPETLVIADSAEPKSIDELYSYGVNVIGAQKGQGSLSQGIQYVQDQQISITKRSVNGIKEYRNYLWTTDRDGKVINVPESGYDHFLDAARYAMESLRPDDGPVAAYHNPNYSH